jgi:hypothetical protein
MPSAGFEPAITATKRPQTYAGRYFSLCHHIQPSGYISEAGGHETANSPPFIAEIRNTWMFTSMPLHVLGITVLLFFTLTVENSIYLVTQALGRIFKTFFP